MINNTDNVITNKNLGRIVKINEDLTQITISNSRYYKYKEEFYPSVTFVLSYWPKGDNFADFLKSNGENADTIASEAAIRGSNVHTAIEKMLGGKELKWINESGYVNYSLDEWLMINRFHEFWSEFKPKLIKTEYHIHSDNHKIAGTIDLIIEMDGEIWILDIKTSKALYTTYDLQTAIYQEIWNENFPEQKATRSGILWLNAKTRKFNKEKIQGKGWSLCTSDRTQEENINIFNAIYQIFRVENPVLKPINEQYVNTLKLDL